jgi:hypothetical protein
LKLCNLLRTIVVPLALFALVLTTAGWRSCSAEEKTSAERHVASGLKVAAGAVEPGINTMRALREAGEVEPATSLRLAKATLEANSAAARLTQSALDGADAKSLADQLEAVVALARNLEADGTLHLKNGHTKLVFELGVTAAQSGLTIALDELKERDANPAPFNLSDSTKEKLRVLLPVFERNDRLLREAITNLTPN